MENYAQLVELVEKMKADVEAFYNKGNKSAGTRIRSVCQEIKKISQNLRINVQETKKAKA